MATLSIILPFYKRAKELEYSLTQFNRHYLAPHEVILVLDEPTQKSEVRDIVPLSWRIIVNPNDHEWRTPAVPINVGIKAASGQYIAVFSPESLMVNNVPQNLLNSVGPKSFATGQVGLSTYEKVKVYGIERCYEESRKMGYGSICAPRRAFFEIGGYDESFVAWGGEDSNLRARFRMHGLTQAVCPQVKILHPDHPEKLLAEKQNMPRNDNQRIFQPANKIANIGKIWGRF